ncbi:MAG: dihydroorotate dehydrogenase electron transfer subunit, partial [Chloroflexi bacterium]|nr:dihydroorotate dehydrogenase electron transfer subunit [Chloroflexota bacterium]
MRSVVVEVTESARLYGASHVLWLTMPDALRHAEPGQFVMAYAGEHADPLLGRAISVHRLRDGSGGREFALLFDVVGRGTDWLARRSPGDAVRVVGPLGRGF